MYSGMADRGKPLVIMKLRFVELLIMVLFIVSEATALANNRFWEFNRFRHRSWNASLSLGDRCDPVDLRWYSVLDQPHKFAYCHRGLRRIVIDSCATVNGIQKLFDEAYQQCVMPAAGEHKAPGLPRSSRFGEVCSFNTDCLNNMYCPAGTCLCLVGFIDVGSDCYTVINPGQNGCINKRQCEAVWPGSDCEDGICRCPKPKTAVETRDGFVCVAPGTCPLPEDSEAPTPPAQLSAVVDTTKPQCVPNVAPTSDKEGCYDSTAKQSLADLYDCIPNGNTGSATGGDEAGGLCCPNRALTCILPKKTATNSSTKSVTRYYYNSVTGSCEQFLWDPTYADSTANNFRTQDQCRSFCQAGCKRGAPEYSLSTKAPKPKSCSVNSECTRSDKTIYQCSTVGARQFCCPSTDWICSPSGGRDYAPSQVPDPGPDSSTKTAVVRWYYDQTAQSCRSFSYKGEGGNFNNFHTAEECSAFCARSLCERGAPLKDSSGNNQQCTGSRGCPSTYECRQSVCCPRKQTVCVQPKMVGTCTSAISRYWYSAATRDCEQFVYTGCNGNDNNFESYLACQNYCRDAKPEPKCIQGEADKDSNGNFYTCSLNSASSSACRLNYECYFDGYMYGCCPTKAWTCNLNSQVGTACVASTVRWFFDATSKSCQTFTYSGCDGNSNNFQTRQQCEQYCGVGGCPFGGEPYQDSNTMQRKVCNSQSAPCPSGYECTSVTASGSSISYCCPTRAYICGQSPNQGTQCGSTLQRYYFNIATKVCSTFTYFGCGGNENNFATLSQCNNYCSSAACAPGESVYLDANSQKPVTCNIGLQSGCPPTYTCKMDSLTGKNLCCGSSDLGVCPRRERAFVEALSQAIRECQPGVAGTCPTNYLCRANQEKNRYYCCAPDSKALCPSGKAPYRDAQANLPQTCYVNAPRSCPSGYVCQSSIGGISQGFCCSMSGVCPKNSDFYAEPTTGKPRQCVFSGPNDKGQCPTGYACKLPPSSSGSTAGNCCKLPPPPASAVCPGARPVIEGNAPRACAYGQPCPNATVCTPYPANGMSYCCQQASVNNLPPPESTGDGCPPGTSVLVSGDNTERMCDLTDVHSCPSGYSCQFNKEGRKYQCCGTSLPPKSPPLPQPPIIVQAAKPDDDGCPMGQVAAVDSKTQSPRTCIMGNIDDCPAGYACQYSSSSGRGQCCGLSAGCPDRSVAFIDSSTGRPQVCNGENACPAGFTCKAGRGNVICCSSNTGKATELPAPPDGYEISGNADSLCPGGQPAEDPRQSGAPKQCSDSANCPNGYECLPSTRGPVCCPNRVNVCNSPLHHGGVLCPDGVQSSQRYFYNSKTGICQQFTYSGCDGNDNNFASITACDNYCGKGMCPKGEPARSGSSYRTCSGHAVCPLGYECVSPVYGPRDKKVCCPSKTSICSAPSTAGVYCSEDGTSNIEGNAARIYFESHTGKCQQFNYRGCGGNGNNFVTMEECRAFCSLDKLGRGHAEVESEEMAWTLRCPSPNSIPYVASGENGPTRCRLGQPGRCPRGHTCQFSGVQNLYICCSNTFNAATSVSPIPRGYCPKNTVVHIHPTTKLPQACSSFLTCPVNHRCLFSPLRRRGYCCKYTNTTGGNKVGRGDSEEVCPAGLVPYTPAASRTPALCALGDGNSALEPACPIGYGCAYSPKLLQYVCCGKVIAAESAAKAVAPAIDKRPPVTPGNFWSLSTERRLDLDKGCTHGRPFIYPGTQTPLACPGRESTQCPRGYTCELNTITKEFQCCSNGQSWRWGSIVSSNETNEEISDRRTSFITTTVRPTSASTTAARTTTVTPTTRAVTQPEEEGGDYLELYPTPEDLMDASVHRPVPLRCDTSKRKYLGEECCADEQCPHGCRRHRRKKMCLCQSHLILDLTRKPYRCTPTCWAWRDGGTCMRHPIPEEERRLHSAKHV